MNRLLERLAATWRAMSGAQRIALFSVTLITLGSAALLVQFAGEPQYGTLYSELSADDAGKIVDRLTAEGVPFKLANAGTTLLVPVDRIYDLRLELATQGLPNSGPVGFEVFSERGLSMTPFEQRVQFRRALEGELGRTISRLDGVQWVRVHISLPDRTAFQRDRKPATAAVVMSLKAGRELRGSEAAGIAHLISGSVEGLESEHVTILDAKGRLLAKPGGSDDDALAAEAFDVQRRLELELAARAQRLLDAALGSGKSVVTVSAQIDRRKFEERQERVNPDEAAVVSEQRSEETRSAPGELFGGVPGTPSNVPGGLAAEGPPTLEPSRESVTRETINFDFSKSTSQTVVPIGGLQRLSVAVLVDGMYTAPAPPEGEAEQETPPAAEPVYEPRSEQELGQLRDLVMRAVGFDAERGDVIEVQNLRFRPEQRDLAPLEVGFLDRPELWFVLPSLMKGFALLGGLALLALFVLRPALQHLSTLPSLPAAAGQVGPGATSAAPVQIGDAAAELAIPVSKDQAKQVAEAMRQWLRE
jgi:flagellar M-ring protein FliF